MKAGEGELYCCCVRFCSLFIDPGVCSPVSEFLRSGACPHSLFQPPHLFPFLCGFFFFFGTLWLLSFIPAYRVLLHGEGFVSFVGSVGTHTLLL